MLNVWRSCCYGRKSKGGVSWIIKTRMEENNSNIVSSRSVTWISKYWQNWRLPKSTWRGVLVKIVHPAISSTLGLQFWWLGTLSWSRSLWVTQSTKGHGRGNEEGRSEEREEAEHHQEESGLAIFYIRVVPVRLKLHLLSTFLSLS